MDETMDRDARIERLGDPLLHLLLIGLFVFLLGRWHAALDADDPLNHARVIAITPAPGSNQVAALPATPAPPAGGLPRG